MAQSFASFGLGKDYFGLWRFPVPPDSLGMPEPRPWQNKCHALLRRFEAMGRPHAFVQAPTGTGKTFAMAHHGENSDVPGARALVVGRDKLVKQHRKSLIRYGWSEVPGSADGVLLSPRGDRWIVVTWQAAAADAARMETRREPSRFLEPGEEVGILFFDEAHIGGCLQEKDGYRSSITRIRDNWQPRFRVYVSATSNIVNEKLLGQRAENSFVYSMAEAYKDGVLHPVNLVEVHCGTTALIRQVEDALGASFERLQHLDDGVEIAAETHDELALQMEEREVALPDRASADPEERARADRLRDQIIRARHEAMLALYFSKHARGESGEQAIFYCPNIKHADEALAHFRRIVAERNMTLRAEAVHTRSPDHEAKIEAFEGDADNRGSVDVLFVVGMLQEGFDMPRLRLAFDCRFYRKWEAPQVARLIQKLGRLTRLDEDTSPKRYYYARDITDYYGSRYMRPDVPDLVEREATANRGLDGTEEPDAAGLEPEEMVGVTAEGVMALRTELAEPGEALDPPEAVHEEVPVDPSFRAETEVANAIFGRSRRIHTVTSKLWELARVSGGHVVHADSITRLIAAEPEMTEREREALDDLFGPVSA